MFNLDKLITDRTIADIQELTAKGYYNLADLTRIQSYIKFLAEKLNLTLTITTYSLGEAVTFDKLKEIVDNIDSIREAWYTADDTPETPIVSGWDWEDANAVEKILKALIEFMWSVENDLRYSGMLVSGETLLFIQ